MDTGQIVEVEATVLEKSHTGEIVLSTTPLGETTQRDEVDLWTPDEAITPPENPEQLALLTESSPVRSGCLDALARNTVGLGYEIDLDHEHEGEVADATEGERRVRNTLEQLARRDTKLDRPTFTELMYRVKWDEEEIGLGALEVSRNRSTGQIDGLFYVPGKYVRRMKDRKGWIIGPSPDLAGGNNSPETTRFYNYGDKVEYGSNGAPKGRLIRGKRWKRNELLVFKLPTSTSRDYGLPRDISLITDYAAAKLASEWNVGFFDASGTPPSLIFVQGVETSSGQRITYKVDDNMVHRVGQTMKADGGRQHRVAIIPVPPGTKVDHIELGKLSERDMGFQGFQDSHANRVIARFRLQPIFVPFVKDAGSRYDAEVQRSITLEQVFDPEQTRYEERLWQTLLYDIGAGQYRLKFKRLAVESDAAKRDSADRLAEAEVITVRELRAAHGLGPLPEGSGDGEFPPGTNDELVSTDASAGFEPVEGDEQQGLRPGLAGRRRRQARDYGNPKDNGHNADGSRKRVGDRT